MKGGSYLTTKRNMEVNLGFKDESECVLFCSSWLWKINIVVFVVVKNVSGIQARS